MGIVITININYAPNGDLMDIMTCIDDVNIQIDNNILIIHGNKEFSIFGNSINSRVKTIINCPFDEDINPKKNIQMLLKNKKISDDAALIIKSARIKHNAVKTINYVTAVVSADISNVYGAGETVKNVEDGFINIILLIDKNLSHDLLIKSFSWAIEAKIAALWDLDLRSQNDDLAAGNINDSLTVAYIEDNEEPSDEKELRALIGKCVRDAAKQSILNGGYSKDVLDYIEGIGIKIDDLVEAGMELVVGVPKSEELAEKLHNQILKSLKDLNVVSFIIAGIRLEEDYKKHRVEGINVDDDPAYLYSDEVFGMSVANQIAGTKAIFNFKRYDEEKPGIIAELGPVLDDIFAGLVAGCTSKIFEDDW